MNRRVVSGRSNYTPFLPLRARRDMFKGPRQCRPLGPSADRGVDNGRLALVQLTRVQREHAHHWSAVLCTGAPYSAGQWAQFMQADGTKQ